MGCHAAQQPDTQNCMFISMSTFHWVVVRCCCSAGVVCSAQDSNWVKKACQHAVDVCIASSCFAAHLLLGLLCYLQHLEVYTAPMMQLYPTCSWVAISWMTANATRVRNRQKPAPGNSCGLGMHPCVFLTVASIACLYRCAYSSKQKFSTMRLALNQPQLVRTRPICSALVHPVSQQRPRHIAVRVAAVEEQASFQDASQQPEAVVDPVEQPAVAQDFVEQELLQELELVELDAAQEQLLAWMVDLSEEEQEADLDEAMDYDEFTDAEYAELGTEVERLMDEADVDLRVGDRIYGTVYEVDDEGAYVDIGQKASGFVPLAECSFAKLKSPWEVLRVGMKREFVVVDREDDYGQIVLSLAALEATVFWQRIQLQFEEQIPVDVVVESANKGGLLVKYGPYEGFVPVSQFGPQLSVENMESLVGQQLSVKFLEVDEERERLVFSHRKASVPVAAEGRQLDVGQVVEGVVQTVKPYGAFVDIGNGTTGLLHVSQISGDRVNSLEKILREGDRLKVMVLGLDKQRGRVTLSTKKLERTPGEMLTSPQTVYEHAEERGAEYRERMGQKIEQEAAAAAATASAAGQPAPPTELI